MEGGVVATRRKKQSVEATLFEAGPVGGGAVGLYIVASHLTHHPPRPGLCPVGQNPGACIGHATNLALAPMVEGTVVGAIVGLLLAAALIALWRGTRAS